MMATSKQTPADLLEYWEQEINNEANDDVLKEKFGQIYHDLLKNVATENFKDLKNGSERKIFDGFVNGKKWLNP